ncbi:hypothetical protein DAKH74_044020 [Maudiozyma humilis]|uniref:PNPLA domain-containing protein n=1 Tax=Maudiozyma humilis TaxID=51915 RepID=A0AAV5S2X7_MAUHU|nr:hypothetical protein DAKH74_044020 [Kazachstania humilis]
MSEDQQCSDNPAVVFGDGGLGLTEPFSVSKIFDEVGNFQLGTTPMGLLSSTRTMMKIYYKATHRYFALGNVYMFIKIIKYLLLETVNPSEEELLIRIYNDSPNVSIANFASYLDQCILVKRINEPYCNARIKYIHSESVPKSWPSEAYADPVIVATKNGKLDAFFIKRPCPLLLKKGDVVLCDRGEGQDIVCIVEPRADRKLVSFLHFLTEKASFDSKLPASKIHDNKAFIRDFIATTLRLRTAVDPNNYMLKNLLFIKPIPRYIYRFATKDEVTNGLRDKYADELKVLHAIKSINPSYNNSACDNDSSSPALPVLNVEYQFDRKRCL